MKIERGMKFRNLNGIKCTIASTFMEGNNEIITYRYWSKRRQRWFFETEFKDLFLIAFEYGWVWDKKYKK